MPSDYAMALVIPIRQVRPWIIALYKFLCRHLRLRPTLNPNVSSILFRRIVFVYKILCLKWEAWFGKQKYSKPPSSNTGPSDRVKSGDQDSNETHVDETVVPLDNISCSLYPYGTGLHDSARSSRILNASRSSHNLGIISRSQNPSWASSQNAESTTRSPLGGGYTFTIQPTSPRRTYSMSSPELRRPQLHPADLHESVIKGRHPVSQILLQPRSSSPVESIELLSPGEISSLHHTLPRSSIEQPTELPRVGTSSQTHTDDLEIPAFDHHRIYPEVPELFRRYEKRRRM